MRATREETMLLQVTNDVPIAMVTATTYLQTGRPLEHAQLAWLGTGSASTSPPTRVRWTTAQTDEIGDRDLTTKPAYPRSTFA